MGFFAAYSRCEEWFEFWFQVGIGEANWCFRQALVAKIKSIYSHRGLVRRHAIKS